MLFPRQRTNKTLKVFASRLLYRCPLSGRVHDNTVTHQHSTGGTLVCLYEQSLGGAAAADQ